MMNIVWLWRMFGSRPPLQCTYNITVMFPVVSTAQKAPRSFLTIGYIPRSSTFFFVFPAPLQLQHSFQSWFQLFPLRRKPSVRTSPSHTHTVPRFLSLSSSFPIHLQHAFQSWFWMSPLQQKPPFVPKHCPHPSFLQYSFQSWSISTTQYFILWMHSFT